MSRLLFQGVAGVADISAIDSVILRERSSRDLPSLSLVPRPCSLSPTATNSTKNAASSPSTAILDAAREAYLGLYALQHRGQESAGIATADGQRLANIKGMGLVSEIFTDDVLAKLPGHMAIGHTRYSTTGDSALLNAQPIRVDSTKGLIAIAHNGNLVNLGNCAPAWNATAHISKPPPTPKSSSSSSRTPAPARWLTPSPTRSRRSRARFPLS